MKTKAERIEGSRGKRTDGHFASRQQMTQRVSAEAPGPHPTVGHANMAKHLELQELVDNSPLQLAQAERLRRLFGPPAQSMDRGKPAQQQSAITQKESSQRQDKTPITANRTGGPETVAQESTPVVQQAGVTSKHQSRAATQRVLIGESIYDVMSQEEAIDYLLDHGVEKSKAIELSAAGKQDKNPVKLTELLKKATIGKQVENLAAPDENEDITNELGILNELNTLSTQPVFQWWGSINPAWTKWLKAEMKTPSQTNPEAANCWNAILLAAYNTKLISAQALGALNESTEEKIENNVTWGGNKFALNLYKEKSGMYVAPTTKQLKAMDQDGEGPTVARVKWWKRILNEHPIPPAMITILEQGERGNMAHVLMTVGNDSIIELDGQEQAVPNPWYQRENNLFAELESIKELAKGMTQQANEADATLRKTQLAKNRRQKESSEKSKYTKEELQLRKAARKVIEDVRKAREQLKERKNKINKLIRTKAWENEFLTEKPVNEMTVRSWKGPLEKYGLTTTRIYWGRFPKNL